MPTDQRRFQQEYYDRHYPERLAAVREQLVHPLFCSFYDRLAERVLDAGLEDRHDLTLPVRTSRSAAARGSWGQPY